MNLAITLGVRPLPVLCVLTSYWYTLCELTVNWMLVINFCVNLFLCAFNCVLSQVAGEVFYLTGSVLCMIVHHVCNHKDE